LTVPLAANPAILRRWLAFFTTLLGVFTPAIYCDRWTPWLRWMFTGCLIVVLVLLVYVVRAAVVGGVLVGPVAIVGPDV
jgi:hypothetical protein